MFAKPLTKPAFQAWVPAMALGLALFLAPAAAPAIPRSASVEAEAEEGAFPPFREGTAGPAFLKMDRGIPVVHLFGSHREMGRQAGELMGPQIKHLIENYIHELFSEEAREKLDPSVRGFEYRIPRQFRDEMKGMAEAAGVDYHDLLLANSFVDLSGLVACSTLTIMPERSKTGELMVGRNLDFMGLGELEQADVVIVYHAEGDRPAVASVAWPGMVGVTTGINDKGMSLSMLVSLSAQPKFAGMPSVLAFRLFLEEVEATADALDFFQNRKVILPANVALADANDEAAVVELDPYTGNALRVPEDGFLPCTNVFASTFHNSIENDPRFQSLKRAAESAPRHGFMDLRKYLGEVAPSGGRLANLQTMIILPKRQIMYMSLKTEPAAEGKLLRFNFKKLFEKAPAEEASSEKPGEAEAEDE